MNGETMIGLPVVILSMSVLLALWPMLSLVAILAIFFLAIGFFAIVDDLILNERVLKDILRFFFGNSAQLG